jgi:hypothetical protein
MALGLILVAATAAAQADDRIFADGFEPCCRIGGVVSGLSGGGLVLQLTAVSVNEDKPIAGNGIYDFVSSVPTGTAYALSVKTQPTGQTCSLTISGGTMGLSNIDNADVICVGNLNWNSGTWGQNWN